jgi:hypothetical protein
MDVDGMRILKLNMKCGVVDKGIFQMTDFVTKSKLNFGPNKRR